MLVFMLKVVRAEDTEKFIALSGVVRVEGSEYSGEGFLKRIKSKALVAILVFEENGFELPQRYNFLKLSKSYISDIDHPFGQIHLLIVLLIFIECRAADIAYFLLTEMAEKVFQKNQTQRIIF